LPFVDGKLQRTGQVGNGAISVEEAAEDAKIVALNALSIVRAAVGSLDMVRRCVKLAGYVASVSGFFGQPTVLNAASELLHDIFGKNGEHCRVAIGARSLPLNATVEIDFIFEIDSSYKSF
ncbi:MAG: RidA family protein, partial [Candidatus Magnetoovum sp. WYHC-5]|nr:RidA family protein [Candidatus Magnetoovum sp. WYHC-5]